MCTKMRAFEPLAKRELKTEGFTVKSTMKNSVVSTWLICYSSLNKYLFRDFFILFKLTLKIDKTLVIMNADEYSTDVFQQYYRYFSHIHQTSQTLQGILIHLSDSIYDK